MLARLGDDHVAASPLAGRVGFLLGPDAPGVRALAAALARRGGHPAVPTRLFDDGLDRVYGNFLLGAGEGGLSALIDDQTLLGMLRRIADACLLGARSPGPVVEWSPGHRRRADVIAAVYPDAVLVWVDGDDAGPPAAHDPRRVLRVPAARVADDPDAVAAALAPDLGLDSPTPPARAPSRWRLAARRARRRSAPAPLAPPPLPLDGPLSPQAVLVFGVPRSGTSWLERLLLSHPATAGVPLSEPRLFLALSSLAATQRDGDLGAWVDSTTFGKTLRGAVGDVYRTARDRHGPAASHFVDKTPLTAQHLDLATWIVPDAWYVHIVRDGRDVVRSLLEMEHATSDVAEAAAHWRRTLDVVRGWAPRIERFREVRYEALLADPVGVTSDLLEWMGLPAAAAVRDAIADNATRRVSQFNTTGPVGSGKWQTLPPDQLDVVLRIAGDRLEEYGYLPRPAR